MTSTARTARAKVAVATELAAFFDAQFPATAVGVDHHIDLFDSGVIDSVGVTETVAHLEARYEVHIPDEILLSDAFTTIAGMAGIIVDLQGAGAQ